MHQIKNHIFARFGKAYGQGYSFEVPEKQEIESYLDRLSRLPIPVVHGKRQEYESAHAELSHILTGIIDGSINTTIRTSLPYALSIRPMTAKGTWRTVPFTMRIRPIFAEAVEGMAAVGNAIVQPVGSTRWQAGVTDVEIVFHCLLDGDAWTPELRALNRPEGSPIDGWPNSYTSCFGVIYDVFWRIRSESGVQDVWPPAPRDIGPIECSLSTTTASNLCFRQRHMGRWTTIVNPDRSEIELELGAVEPPSHWKRCRETASSYLALGDTREALLFLNIGVESLLDERFKALADANNDPSLLDLIYDKKSVWQEARDIVAKQAPAAADKIVWPEREVHQTRYSQLKLAHKHSSPVSSVRQATKHYNIVCHNRNELVHGTREEPIPVSDALKAFHSFDWLVDNFAPSGPVS
ncbi:hypothetical protein AB0D87_48895 [Streptomyces sp. NPDC048342]|uniref:hypothetical protein n=1 Tax=unclassified Streptomyces TaxID=2593676 RepID=UPI003418DCE3